MGKLIEMVSYQQYLDECYPVDCSDDSDENLKIQNDKILEFSTLDNIGSKFINIKEKL